MPVPETGRVASFIPSAPVRVLVLAHGFPWLDGSRSDDDLAAYAQEAVDPWASFGKAHPAVQRAVQPARPLSRSPVRSPLSGHAPLAPGGRCAERAGRIPVS